MKAVKYSLILILCILGFVFLYLLRDNRVSKKYLPEPYAGPEIHIAAMQGDMGRIKLILSEKPELLNKTDKYGNYPLHLAAYKGHAEIVQFFILEGVNINVRNNFGGTALLVASCAGETEVVEVLISSGADTNLVIEDPQKQVLQVVSLEGYRDYGHMFIAHGGVINLKVLFSGSPLQAAAANGNIKIAKNLIDNGASINAMSTGYAALHSAAVNGHKELVVLLIANGANVNAKSIIGETPLFCAMLRCREMINRDSMDDVVEALIKSGADVNTRTRGGYTPLHHAAGCASKRTVQLLLSADANINAKSKDGDTPLNVCLLYTSPSPRDATLSRMPSSA